MLTRPECTKDKLMRAAMEIVAADGFPAATTAVIAERAGFAEGTLYRHFKSKEDLLIALYRRIKSEVFEAAAAETGEAREVKTRARALWRGMWSVYSGDMTAFAFGQRFAESALSKKEGGAAHEAMMSHIRALIADGQAQGVIKDAPADLLIAFFFPPLVSMLKEQTRGRVWTEAEIEIALDAFWASWTGQFRFRP